jgi:hypothetical protein
MAKIKHYEIPAKVTRDPNSGEVVLEIQEDQKKLQNEETVDINEGQDILRLSKKIADDNASELNIAKKILSPEQKESTTTLTMKYLED